MKQYKIIRKKEETDVAELVKISCNKCGKELDYSKESDPLKRNSERNRIHNFNVDFHYGSDYDTQKWEFDLCEECLTAFVKSFKEKPEGYETENMFYEFFPTRD